MIRVLLLSIAVCLGTVGGVYGAVMWKSRPVTEGDKEAAKLVPMKTRMVSVPILADGQVLGYVVTRLQFSADASATHGSSLQPEAFVADEAFKRIYETTPEEMKTGRKQALQLLTDDITKGVNRRLGGDVVHDVLIDGWTYLSKLDMMKNNERGH